MLELNETLSRTFRDHNALISVEKQWHVVIGDFQWPKDKSRLFVKL